ncbi:MAG: YdcF family protein, partial [Firmicutes bacterium]|nr:YdcF family protein [Bacillota bacterium]
ANQGIDPARLIMEDRSENTAQNLQYSAELIKQDSGSGLGSLKIVVCSAEYHLCRARLLSRKVPGFDPGTLPAPTPRPVLRLTYFMREACGLMVQDFYL